MFPPPEPYPLTVTMTGPSAEHPIYAWFVSTEEERLVFLRPQLRLPRRICFSSERPRGSIPESLICTASCAFRKAGGLFLLSGSTRPITRPALDEAAQHEAAFAAERRLNIVDAVALGPWVGTLAHGGYVLIRLDPIFRVAAETEWTFIDNLWASSRRMRPGTEPVRLVTIDTRNRSAFDSEVAFNHEFELEVQPCNRSQRSYINTELHNGKTGQDVRLGRGPRRIDTGSLVVADDHRAIGIALSVNPESSEVQVLMLNDTLWAYFSELTGIDRGDMNDVEFYEEWRRVNTLWTHLELR